MIDFAALGRRFAAHPDLMTRPMGAMSADDIRLMACLFWDKPSVDLAFVGQELAQIDLLQTPVREMSKAQIRALQGVFREGVNLWEAAHDEIPF